MKIKTNNAFRLEDETDAEDLSELAKRLLTDFQKSTSLHILNNIVFLVQQALEQVSAASTSWFIALTTLVDALYARFNHSRDLTDLNEAISRLQDASKCCTKQDRKELNINSRICGLLATRCDLLGDIFDLQTALDWTIKGTATSTGIPESLEYASELCKQFTTSGNMADLITAVTLFREGIAELPLREVRIMQLLSIILLLHCGPDLSKEVNKVILMKPFLCTGKLSSSNLHPILINPHF